MEKDFANHVGLQLFERGCTLFQKKKQTCFRVVEKEYFGFH